MEESLVEKVKKLCREIETKTITEKDVVNYFENLSFEKQRKLLEELEKIHNPML